MMIYILHTYLRWLYWTASNSTGTRLIEKASMDGRNRTTIYTDINYGWVGLTIDYVTQVLYCADTYRDIIWSMNTDGTNFVTLATRTQGLFVPFGITFFNDVLYFTDLYGHSVYSMSKDANITGEPIITIFSHSQCTYSYYGDGVVAVSEGRQTECKFPIIMYNAQMSSKYYSLQNDCIISCHSTQPML